MRMTKTLLTGIAVLFLATGIASAEEQLPSGCLKDEHGVICWCSLDEACRAWVRRQQKPIKEKQPVSPPDIKELK